MPSKHGIGTEGFIAVDSGYASAADRLIQLRDEGRKVDTSDYYVRKVLDRYGASNVDELKTKRRGW